MVVSIHQPNFIPWVPFFNKIRNSDIFILLRHCQYEKSNYQNRFFYRDRWRTMSVNKGRHPIIEKRYCNHIDDWLRIKESLKDQKPVLDIYDSCISGSLVDSNISIILKTLEILQIKTLVEYDFPTSLLASDRLVELCKYFNAKTYLSGIGGRKYLEVDKFNAEGIHVEFQHIAEDDRCHLLDSI
jgi:hypothetical protein